MTRDSLHKKVDELLDEMGFEKTISVKWGSIMIQVDFQKGEEVVTIGERRTKK